MSKDSSIKVFAENVGDTNPRPVNNIPVWIENVSAIGGGGGGGDIPSEVSGKWEDASDCVQTNSASWGQGGGDNNVFYIYPGITTQQEVSENSGKNMKLYMSATNTYLDYAGKYTNSTGVAYCFRSISGAPRTLSYVNQVGINVKPDSAGVVLPFYTQKDTLVTEGGTVANANLAQTAYYDGNSNSLTDTYYSIQNLSSFVQNNSASWGGSGPTGDSGKVLFHKYYYYDPSNGTQNENSFVSGARNLFFEAAVNKSLGTPNEMIVLNNGFEVGRVYWTQTSSNEYTNYYTATYTNSYGEIEFSKNGFNTYTFCRMSANGIKTDTFNQNDYSCDTQTNVKFNITGNNITGNIFGYDGNHNIGITSFTGALSDFNINGYFSYGNNSYYENYGPYFYDLSAEFISVGGSTVTSGDVLPPAPTGTGNTYALYWNDANGLFWDIR